MITLEKLKEYEEFHGYYDGFYIQKVKKGSNLTSDDEWRLISDLTQDVRLMQKNLAADAFIERLINKLNENCDNVETVEYLKMIAAQGW